MIDDALVKVDKTLLTDGDDRILREIADDDDDDNCLRPVAVTHG
jgi:hypothetical protein